MTKASDEYPDHPTYKETISDISEGSTICLNEFDSKTNDLHDRLAILAATFDPTADDNEVIDVDLLDSVTDSFRKYAANLIVEEGVSDATVDLIARLCKVNNDIRISLLAPCMNCDKCLEEFDTQTLVERFTEIVTNAETPGKAVDEIAAFYINKLGEDLKIYYEHMNELCMISHPDVYDDSSEEQDNSECDHDAESGRVPLEIVKSTKEHFTDVAKIAAGVFAALAVDRLIHRKR